MTGKRAKRRGGEANSPRESWWSGRRLPIPKTPAHRPGANAHRKQPEICVTDSCGELITFCPVSGWSPPGGRVLTLPYKWGFNAARERTCDKVVGSTGDGSATALEAVSFVLRYSNPPVCHTREKHSGADYVPKYEEIRSIGS